MVRQLLTTLLIVMLVAPGVLAQGQASTEGLDMQAARAKMMTERGRKVAYTKKFDLSGLPHYQPRQKVSGTIRIWGSNYVTDGFLRGYWEPAFRTHHPDVQITLPHQTT